MFESVISSLFPFLIIAAILGFFKVATVKTYIEGDSRIIRYILRRSENSPGCSTFLTENGYQSPLTKEYLQGLIKQNRTKFISLVNELNIIINQEAYLKSKNGEE